ncbi:hypothetical protein BUALT_Bualt01G0114400 [Buddleja alternifolia]|uniref:RNA-binding protein Luc7-like 2 n=1 Tax=Buddleja alternifolia TaxID=168488 RepID=A0AAV6YCU7_9LAMI|nr:hypothetical protein BUALT_Bualt01G0114400 [Buddleja alternifolia]
MDALRKQLDVLMGANRNGDSQEVTRKYYDRDVCRLFLAGLCPHELFQLTKMDKGPCPKIHSLQLRKEYEEAKAKGVDNYDRDLEDNIDRLIVECDRKIARALKRLDEEDAKAAIAISVSEVTQTPEVIEMSKQIKEKLKEADQSDLEAKTDIKIRALEEVEELRTKRADKQDPFLGIDTAIGEQGMVDEAQKALEEAEALKKLPARQEPVMDSSKYTAVDVRITDQKLRVCDICGAFLSVYDSDRRLADHFGGKLHLGYMQIREKLAELLVRPLNLLSNLIRLTIFFYGLESSFVVLYTCVMAICFFALFKGHAFLQCLSRYSEYFGSEMQLRCLIEATCPGKSQHIFQYYSVLPPKLISFCYLRCTRTDLRSISVSLEERDKKRKAYEEERRSKDRKSRDRDRESSRDRDRETALVAMTQGVNEYPDPGQENVQEIMIVTGVMIAISRANNASSKRYGPEVRMLCLLMLW